MDGAKKSIQEIKYTLREAYKEIPKSDFFYKQMTIMICYQKRRHDCYYFEFDYNKDLDEWNNFRLMPVKHYTLQNIIDGQELKEEELTYQIFTLEEILEFMEENKKDFSAVNYLVFRDSPLKECISGCLSVEDYVAKER